MANKEYGSDFHYIERIEDYPISTFFQKNDYKLYFSGRVALYNILKEGIEKYSWSRVGFPSYYCHEVVEFCAKLPIDIIYYSYNPFDNNLVSDWSDTPSSVFIKVDFFGIQKLDTFFLTNSVVIEDLTHNLLAISDSTADYCFASLRKQLPMGIGGIAVGVKHRLDYDEVYKPISERVAIRRLVAMFLKAEYLLGKFNDKVFFRKLFAETELFLKHEDSDSRLPVFFREQLFSLDSQLLIEDTLGNISFALNYLEKRGYYIYLNNLGLILLFERKQDRDKLRSFLIERRVYPATLWPNQKFDIDIDFSNRMLFVHLDFRYDKSQILDIVSIINQFRN